jgi:hypothetical protein
MSTRGFAGIGTPTQWSGRYNHYDSYPTGLGAEVWATAQRFFYDDQHLHGFAHRLLSFTDWRQMATQGICEYCGQRTGHPHSISGLIAVPFLDRTTLPDTEEALRQQKLEEARRYHWSEERRALMAQEVHDEWQIVQNLRSCGYPDPDARYHEHDVDDPAASAVTPDTCDWLFMEWGYVLDPNTQTLHVFVGGIETPMTCSVDIIRPDGTHEWWHDKTRYTGALVGSYPLTAPEPDWQAVDQEGQTVCAQLAKDFAAHPDHPLLASVRALPLVEVWDQTILS